MKLLDDLFQTAGAMGTVLRRGLSSPVARRDALPLRGNPVLRGELCTGCQACVEACPTACLDVGEAEGLPVLALDWRRCMCCGICARVCPENAILLSAEAGIAREERRP